MQTGRTGGSGDGGGEGTGPKRRGFTWSGWEARVAADPEFVYKILVEQVGVRTPSIMLLMTSVHV